MHNFSK